jgi:hypothetical protein
VTSLMLTVDTVDLLRSEQWAIGGTHDPQSAYCDQTHRCLTIG